METLNEEIKKIMETEGRVIGEVFKTDAGYVLEKKGEEGLKAVEKETEKMGYPIDYQKIKSIDWYPIGLRIVSLFAVMKTFNWGEKEIEDMGKSAPKISYIVRMFTRFFISPKMAAKSISRLWPRHYSIGNGKVIDFEERKENQEISGSCSIQIKNFKVHPLLCVYLGGYFLGLIALFAKPKKITIEEIKYPFKGDPFHQYSLKWTRY